MTRGTNEYVDVATKIGKEGQIENQLVSKSVHNNPDFSLAYEQYEKWQRELAEKWGIKGASDLSIGELEIKLFKEQFEKYDDHSRIVFIYGLRVHDNE
jgi:hypothetical protein